MNKTIFSFLTFSEKKLYLMKNLKEYKDTNDLTSKLSPHESIVFHLPLLLFMEDIYMIPKSNPQN